jgi:hypothetical protein
MLLPPKDAEVWIKLNLLEIEQSNWNAIASPAMSRIKQLLPKSEHN